MVSGTKKANAATLTVETGPADHTPSNRPRAQPHGRHLGPIKGTDSVRPRGQHGHDGGAGASVNGRKRYIADRDDS